METTLNKLKAHSSKTPSRWREEAEFRQDNKAWMRYSQMVAMKMLDRMEELGLTQKQLADKMSCSQQYISKVLKGRENLSLETLFKIESVLNLKLICEPEFA